MLDVGLSLLKRHVPALERLIEGVPTVLVAEGKPIEARMRLARVTLDDVLQAARISRGLISIGEIRFATLETDGTISIVPFGSRRDEPS
jgi:uncharacterized membrane protein YcaP (DUF421 family)